MSEVPGATTLRHFLICNPASTASFWIYWVLVTLAVVFAIVFLFTVFKNGPRDLVVFRPGAKVFKAQGAIVYAFVSVALFVLVFSFSWIDHKLGLNYTQSAQRMDLQVGETLENIRDRFASKSARTILLTGNVGAIVVQGQYEGECTADMFYKICLRKGLNCEWPASEPTMLIRAAPR